MPLATLKPVRVTDLDGLDMVVSYSDKPLYVRDILAEANVDESQKVAMINGAFVNDTATKVEPGTHVVLTNRPSNG